MYIYIYIYIETYIRIVGMVGNRLGYIQLMCSKLGHSWLGFFLIFLFLQPPFIKILHVWLFL